MACNVTEGTSAVAENAKAYVITTTGDGLERVEVLARSRGGRWIRWWTTTARLRDFRPVTIVPESPRFTDPIQQPNAEGLAASLAVASANWRKQVPGSDLSRFRGNTMEPVPYDSRPDTYEHIAQVRALMLGVVERLLWRAHEHDQSKLETPEREMFDEFTPKLRNTTYGSPEYKANMSAMGEGLKHHYVNNRHHPEFFGEMGFRGMSLLDMVEMLCDWKAATMRHADGDLDRSITVNAERYGFGPEIEGLIRNTAQDMGMI